MKTFNQFLLELKVKEFGKEYFLLPIDGTNINEVLDCLKYCIKNNKINFRLSNRRKNVLFFKHLGLKFRNENKISDEIKSLCYNTLLNLKETDFHKVEHSNFSIGYSFIIKNPKRVNINITKPLYIKFDFIIKILKDGKTKHGLDTQNTNSVIVDLNNTILDLISFHEGF